MEQKEIQMKVSKITWAIAIGVFLGLSILLGMALLLRKSSPEDKARQLAQSIKQALDEQNAERFRSLIHADDPNARDLQVEVHLLAASFKALAESAKAKFGDQGYEVYRWCPDLAFMQMTDFDTFSKIGKLAEDDGRHILEVTVQHEYGEMTSNLPLVDIDGRWYYDVSIDSETMDALSRCYELWKSQVHRLDPIVTNSQNADAFVSAGDAALEEYRVAVKRLKTSPSL